MTESRADIEAYVRTHPGSHFSAIVTNLDQATGQVQHHLSRLVRADRLERASVHGRTHYYPPGYDAKEKEVLALLRRESTRAIVTRLLDTDGQRPDTLAATLGLARSTIEYHLEHLRDAGVLDKRRDARGRVTVELTDSRTVRRLLADVTSDPASPIAKGDGTGVNRT